MMVRATMVISVIITLLVLNQSTYCNAKRRWCTDGTLTEETQSMTEYNDEEQVCMKCEKEEKLIDLQELNLHECCAGEVKPLGVCPDESVRHSCNRAQKCDDQKQCKDGSDEMGCFGCGNNSFSCQSDLEETQCISVEKVCDSEKNCVDGKDETICPYHGGWCDGFLCGDKHQKCIEYSKICDGTKNCVDGSDESNCQYCPNQFRCRTYFRDDINATSAECVGMFRVCDGTDDCSNGRDEADCYAWQEWSAWSGCGVETESCTRIRRRSCVDKENVVVSSSRCVYNESDTNENEIDICPTCLEVENSTSTVTPATKEQSTVQGRSNGLPFSTGALAGIIVVAALLFIGVIVAIAIGILGFLGRTGFWRPSTKLPRSTSSRLPGVTTASNNRVSPRERITNPYADIENGRINGMISSGNSTISTTTSMMRSIS